MSLDDASPRAESATAACDGGERLGRRHAAALRYIREKTDQLLGVIGTVPLRPEELDDETLLELDPIGIVSDSFVQVLAHLNETNAGLRSAHDEIDAIFRSVGVGILVLDRDYRILEFNEAQRGQFFHGVDAPTHRPCYEAICSLGAPPPHCAVARVLATGQPAHRRAWRVRDRCYDIVATPVQGTDGRVSKVVVAYTDVTDRLAAEQTLRESEERYRDLFESASDLIQSVRPDGSFAFVNRAWREALGYTPEEAVRLTIHDVVHPDCARDCAQAFQRVLAGETLRGIEVCFRAKDGRTLLLEGNASCSFDRGRPVATRGIFRDVTAKRRLEDELRRAQKLESVGVLAGGIAHDFNNLLTGILANLSTTLLRGDGGAGSHRRLLEAEKAALRAADLTQQLLTFSRGGEPLKRAFRATELVRESAALALAGSASRMTLTAPEDLWAVVGDEGQIGQVLRNLLLNADQAMPAGGTIDVRCDNVRLDADADLPLDPGRYVRITVEDHGIGIAPEHLARVFDPYFTTKHKGSGLGLAVAYSVVAKHGGHLAVASRLGRGTTLRVHLPAAPAAEACEEAPPPREAVPPDSARVLVMDDEEFIRDAASEILSEFGFRVQAARDGREAIALYRREREAGAPFDVVVMDLTVPGGMGGREAIEELRAFDPDVRAVVSSGYSNDPIMANFRDHGFAGVVAKPYTVSALLGVLRDVLSARG